MAIEFEENFKLAQNQSLRKVLLPGGEVSITNGGIFYEDQERESSKDAEIRAKAFNFNFSFETIYIYHL